MARQSAWAHWIGAGRVWHHFATRMFVTLKETGGSPIMIKTDIDKAKIWMLKSQ
jgi:hypothetical protein